MTTAKRKVITKLKKVNFLLCDYCAWKKTFRNFDELKIHQIEESKFRCPQCGRLIKLRLVEDTQKKLNIEINSEERKEEFKKWTKENFQE